MDEGGQDSGDKGKRKIPLDYKITKRDHPSVKLPPGDLIPFPTSPESPEPSEPPEASPQPPVPPKAS